jgi:hypothetical protein
MAWRVWTANSRHHEYVSAVGIVPCQEVVWYALCDVLLLLLLGKVCSCTRPSLLRGVLLLARHVARWAQNHAYLMPCPMYESMPSLAHIYMFTAQYCA